MDGDYVEENHNLESGTFDLINDDGIVEEGSSGFQTMDSLFNQDLSVQENFNALAAVVDMTNFADYWATEYGLRQLGHNVVLSWR